MEIEIGITVSQRYGMKMGMKTPIPHIWKWDWEIYQSIFHLYWPH